MTSGAQPPSPATASEWVTSMGQYSTHPSLLHFHWAAWVAIDVLVWILVAKTCFVDILMSNLENPAATVESIFQKSCIIWTFAYLHNPASCTQLPFWQEYLPALSRAACDLNWNLRYDAYSGSILEKKRPGRRSNLQNDPRVTEELNNKIPILKTCINRRKTQ